MTSTGSCRSSGRAALAGALVIACVGTAGARAEAAPLRAIASADVSSTTSDPGLIVQSDAHRWYAYQQTPGTVVAADTGTGHRREIATPTSCTPEAVRFGLVLLSCDRDPKARLVTLETGAATDFPDLDSRNGKPFPDSFSALGRYWLGGFTCESSPHCAQVYINRVTQERRVVSIPDDADNPAVPLVDVDTPDLDPSSKSGLVDIRIGAYRLTQADDRAHPPLYLLHLGDRRRLSRCRLACDYVSFGGGVITWSEGPVALAYSVRLQRTISWRVPFTPMVDGSVTTVVHTTRFVLVETTEAGNGGTGLHETLYRASIPKRR
jgi:hypothetical protein